MSLHPLVDRALAPPTALAALVALVATTACDPTGAPEAGGLDGEWQAQVDTVGDTISVRTVAGSEWGTARLEEEVRIGALEGEEWEEFGAISGLTVDGDGAIYVFDRQVPALRVYEPDGSYRRTLGGEGSGPGEYGASDGGIVVMDDGRVILRDPANGRFNVYGPDGEAVDQLPGPQNQYMSSPIIPAVDGGFYNPTPGGGGLGRYTRFEPDGTVTDTLDGPEAAVEVPRLRAEGEQSMIQSAVPHTPLPSAIFHPEGYFVASLTGEYALDLLRPDGPVLRLGRDRDPVPVSGEERSTAREEITERMRSVDPDWGWDGPEIPEVKPAIRWFHTGLDGRLWVALSQPAEPVEEDEEAGRPQVPMPGSTPGFREPVVYDVFEPDGRYLGRVEAPEGFSPFPFPVFRGDHVWAVTRDEWGVEYVTRYRIER